MGYMMKPELRSLILDLAIARGGGDPRATRQKGADVMKFVGTTDGVRLGLELLNDATERHDGTDVELAMIVCFSFGFTEDHLGALRSLAYATWHERHEDVATALGIIRSGSSVDALVHLASWVPEYLAYDSAFALGVKAVWALAGIQSIESMEALQALAESTSIPIAQAALSRIRR
jgi:hypothetical protein